MLKAMLVGNLGNDPEDLRYSAEGRPFLRFNVASNSRVRSQSGEWQDHTEWVRVTATGPRAEFLSQFLRKGTFVCVDGRLDARPWLDRSQQPRAGLELICNASDVHFQRPRSESTDDMGAGGYHGDRDRDGDRGDSGPAARPAERPRQQPGPRPVQEADLDDLPF
jgi:single-strand DNA-binding protein